MEEKEPATVENPNWVDPDTIKKPVLAKTESEPQEDPLFIKHSDVHSENKQPAPIEKDVVFQQPTQTQVLRAARRNRSEEKTL